MSSSTTHSSNSTNTTNISESTSQPNLNQTPQYESHENAPIPIAGSNLSQQQHLTEEKTLKIPENDVFKKDESLVQDSAEGNPAQSSNAPIQSSGNATEMDQGAEKHHIGRHLKHVVEGAVKHITKAQGLSHFPGPHHDPMHAQNLAPAVEPNANNPPSANAHAAAPEQTEPSLLAPHTESTQPSTPTPSDSNLSRIKSRFKRNITNYATSVLPHLQNHSQKKEEDAGPDATVGNRLYRSENPTDDVSVMESPSNSKSNLVQKKRRILILYTGGTIGMQELSNGSYAPKAGFLVENLMGMYQFQAPNKPVRTMPVTKSGIEPTYDIIEYYPLLDSVNMTYSEWNKIAKDIQRFYNDYDAFVILHGTDTMAYTASALSFLLQNLSKTVVLTGSQIPLSQTRSDATDNLVGAMTIAIELNIPEVCIFFNGRLMRGNRCTKSNATGLKAFSSPKHPILAKLAIDLDVKWAVILPQPAEPLVVHQMASSGVDVACLQLFPGMTDKLLRKFLEPPLTGLVLLTYGAGNAPDSRQEFTDALKEASDRGVVIVNCTQCQKGSVSQDTYAVGVALTNAGVISGGDMTPEAALTKLLYLQSLGISNTAVKKKMQVDMRGERTVKSALDFQRQQSNFLSLVARTLREHPSSTDFDLFKSFLSPVVLCSFASKGDLKELQALVETNAVDVNAADYDSRRPLHLAVGNGHKDTVLLLLRKGADPNLTDKYGRSSLDEALSHGYTEIADILRTYGAVERCGESSNPEMCAMKPSSVNWVSKDGVNGEVVNARAPRASPMKRNSEQQDERVDSDVESVEKDAPAAEVHEQQKYQQEDIDHSEVV